MKAEWIQNENRMGASWRQNGHILKAKLKINGNTMKTNWIRNDTEWEQHEHKMNT